MLIGLNIKFDYLLENCWQGALYTLYEIDNNGLQEEFMELLEFVFPNIPTMTEVNDFLWFEDEFIYENLGIEMECN